MNGTQNGCIHLANRPNTLAQEGVAGMLEWSLPLPETVAEALEQATTLLTIPNAVKVMAWWKLGEILRACVGDDEVTPAKLANAANEAKDAMYCQLVEECAAGGCVDCLGFSAKTRPYPCRSTQFTFKMLQPLSTNLTVSHLEACKRLSTKVQPTSPLLTSGLFLPSSLKRFATHSMDGIVRWNAVLGIGTPPPQPPGPPTLLPPQPHGPPTPVPPPGSSTAGPPQPHGPPTPVPPPGSSTAGPPQPHGPPTPVPSPGSSTAVPPQPHGPTTPLPPPGLSTPTSYQLSAGYSPVVAVQYVDGDGGVLIAEYFRGLLDVALKYRVPCQKIQPHGLTLVAFREPGHDTPELGHVYQLGTTTDSAGPSSSACTSTTCTSTTKVPFGYLALVHARRQMAECDSVVVVPHGADGSGRRLVVEVLRTSRSDTVDPTVPTGVGRILAGLSYPVEGAPRQYHLAYQQAVTARLGLHRFKILGDERVLPKALKGLLTGKGAPAVTLENRSLNEVCTIVQDTTYLNEANILVLPSTIEGAGLALFLRPTPAGRKDYAIPRGRRLCQYSDKVVGEEEEVSNTDYCLDRVEGARRITWNPLHPDGANLGRYINQGGLVEGLRALISSCDRTSGAGSFSPKEAEAVFARHCNVTYKYVKEPAPGGRGHKDTLVVTMARDTTSSSTHAIELLGNYGIGYWIPYVLSHHQEWGNDHTLVTLVLWLLLADNSAMELSVRQKFLTGYDIAPATYAIFKDMPCPWTTTTRRCRH